VQRDWPDAPEAVGRGRRTMRPDDEFAVASIAKEAGRRPSAGIGSQPELTLQIFGRPAADPPVNTHT